LITGAPEHAQTYLERLQHYDVEAAELDALVAASQGDLQAAVQKIRWAHAHDALPDDPDLIFLDAVAPTILIPTSGLDVGRCVAFALETQVSDVILAIHMFLIDRIDPREALAIIRAQDQIDAYPLSTATLELRSGDQESARKRLDAYVTSDMVSRCAAILLKEVSASISLPSPAPSIYHAAEEVAQAIDVVDITQLPLSRQVTLVSILTGVRFAVALSGGSTTALEWRASTILTTIRQHHPSHRDLALRLANYGRVGEAQFRDKRKRA
jgi:CheY-like chemotaxis protein